MKPQHKDQFSKMLKFAYNATVIANDIALDKLANDVPYQYSLLYPLGQIGETAINMGSGIPELYPGIEWSDWRGFRNRAFHDYDTIDFPIVLEMITEALPLLLTELHKIHDN